MFKRVFVLHLLLIIVGVTLRCTETSEVVFPGSGDMALVGGRVHPWVRGMRVYLCSVDGTDSAEVDSANGMYSFGDVRYGVYLLRVKAPGYGTGEKEVNVSEPVVNIGTIRLSTMPMQVIDVNPSPGTLIDTSYVEGFPSMLSDTHIFFIVRFVDGMDTASVADAMSVNPPAEGITREWSYEGRYLTIGIPREQIDGDSSLEITIGTAATDLYGCPLDKDLIAGYPVDPHSPLVMSAHTLLYSHWPSDNDRSVDVVSGITLGFISSVDPASTVRAFRIEPQTPPPHITWMHSDSRMEVTFPQELHFGAWYTVTLDSGWMSADSLVSRRDLSFRFMTRFPAVDNYTPVNGAGDVSLTAPVKFSTNFWVDTANARRAFSIEPAVDSLRFLFDVSGRVLSVHHAPFEALTRYEVVIDTQLCSFDSVLIQQSVRFSFITGTAPVDNDTADWSSYADNAPEWGIKSAVTIVFDDTMDIHRVESLLVVEPQFSYYTVWRRGGLSGHSVDLVPRHILRSNTRYTVRIDSDSITASGRRNNPVNFSFTTEPLRCTGLWPIAGIEAVSNEFSVSFNMPVDMESIRKGGIQVYTGDALVDIYGETIDSSGGSWTYRSSFSPLEGVCEYRLVVNVSATDLYGIAMKEGAISEFSFGCGD